MKTSYLATDEEYIPTYEIEDGKVREFVSENYDDGFAQTYNYLFQSTDVSQ